MRSEVTGLNVFLGHYDDILDECRPIHEGDRFSIKHPKMSREKRAKQFMPFDALQGFDEAVGAETKITRHPAALSEEKKDELNEELNKIIKNINSSSDGELIDEVSILYFVRDYDQERLRNDGIRGNYRWIVGKPEKVDQVTREIRISGKWLSFDYIYEIKSGTSWSD